jgi:hypothetical protein
MEKTARPIQPQNEKETRLARTIPPRKASENHISGSRVINDSGMRVVVEGFTACIVVFHHSIEFIG